MNPYETMFVVANKEARKSHEYLEEHVRELITKVGGTVVRLDKWDERQLAYQIDGQKEGVFLLGFVEAEGSAIAELKREVELSELILRMLVLRLDKVPEQEEVDRQSGRAAKVEEEKPAETPEAAAPAEGAPAEPAAEAAPAEPVAGEAAPVADAAAPTAPVADAAAPAAPVAETAEAPAAEEPAPKAESSGTDS